MSVPTTLTVSNVPTAGNALLECSENIITDDDTNNDDNTTIVDNDDNTNSTTTEDDDMMGPYYLGSFQTRAHNVAGDVYLISNRVIEIRVRRKNIDVCVHESFTLYVSSRLIFLYVLKKTKIRISFMMVRSLQLLLLFCIPYKHKRSVFNTPLYFFYHFLQQD